MKENLNIAWWRNIMIRTALKRFDTKQEAAKEIWMKTEQRMTNKAPQLFKDAVKLIALMQAVLEQMDTVKGTSLYRHKIKMQIKALEKSIESTLLEPLNQLDSTDSNLFTKIQSNIEMILEMDTNELSQLRVVLEEERDVI